MELLEHESDPAGPIIRAGPHLQIPDWFLKHNVYLHADGASHDHQIVLVDSLPEPDYLEKQSRQRGRSKTGSDDIAAVPKKPWPITKDTYDELQDIITAMLSTGMNAKDSSSAATILVATSQNHCDHIVTSLVNKLAEPHKADILAFNMEDIEDIAEEFDSQYEENGWYKSLPEETSSHEAASGTASATGILTPQTEDSKEPDHVDLHSDDIKETGLRPDSPLDGNPAQPERTSEKQRGIVEISVPLPATGPAPDVALDEKESEQHQVGEQQATSRNDETSSPTPSPKPDEPIRHGESDVSAFFFEPSRHLSRLGDHASSYESDGEARRDLASATLLKAAASARLAGTSNSDDLSDDQLVDAERPLFIVFQNTSILRDTYESCNIIETILWQIGKMRDGGRRIVVFVPSTFKRCDVESSAHSDCACFDCRPPYSVISPSTAFKASEAPLIKLYGYFVGERYVSTRIHLRQFRRSLRHHLRSKNIEAKLQPCHEFSYEDLRSIAHFESLISKKPSEYGTLMWQLAGRARQQSSLDNNDIVHILDRANRRQAEVVSLIARDTFVHDSPVDSEKNTDYNEFEQKLVARIVNANKIEETFDDVIIDETKLRAVKQVVRLSMLRSDKIQNKFLKRLQVPGIMLHGPPGTGKTQLVRAIANSMSANMLAIEGADIKRKWSGESENMVKAAFSLARKLHPCILFLDEADALFYRRTSDDKSWERSTLNQFLSEMDGITATDKAALVIVATNREKDLDEAFIRRLPHKVKFSLPDQPSRAKILELQLRDVELDQDEVDFNGIASCTKGYSGSDLRNLCQNAMLACLSEQEATLDQLRYITSADLHLKRKHLEQALQETRPPGATARTKLPTRSKQDTATKDVVSSGQLVNSVSVDETRRHMTTLSIPDPTQMVLYTKPSIYTPLDMSRKQIRLLRILPAVEGQEDPLRGELRVVSLQDDPQYECVSYCWMENGITEPIHFDDQAVPITTNLANALRHFRQLDKEEQEEDGGDDVWLWADAICIKQDDMQERSEQIAIMAEIFTKAVRVRAWLKWGLDDNAPRHAAKDVAAGCLTGLKALETRRDWAATTHEVTCLAGLFDNKFWKRLWILQEIALARSIKIYYGLLTYEFHGARSFTNIYRNCVRLLFRFYRLISERHAAADLTLSEYAEKFSDVTSVEEMGRMVPGLLLNLIPVAGDVALCQDVANAEMESARFMLSVKRHCTRKHDHVYGLLGILRRELDIVPDYGRPWPEVLTEFSFKMLESNQSLRLLTCAMSSEPDLPSWAMDLAKTMQTKENEDGPALPSQAFAQEPYSATEGSSFVMVAGPMGTIQIPGILLGKIKSVAPVREEVATEKLFDPPNVREALWACVRYHAEATEMKLREDNGKTVPDVDLALLRTLLLDLEVHEGPEEGLGIQARGPISADDLAQHKEHVDDFLAGGEWRGDLRVFYNLAMLGSSVDLFILEEGQVGLAEKKVEVEDQVCLLATSPKPFCVRRLERRGMTGYSLISECYADGCMFGEALEARVQALQAQTQDRTVDVDEAFHMMILL